MSKGPNELRKQADLSPLTSSTVPAQTAGDVGRGRAEESEGDGNRKKRPRWRLIRFFFWGLMFFGLLFIAAAIVTGIWIKRFSAPIDSEKVEMAKTADLVGWLLLRDLDKESPEIREKLAGRYFQPIQDGAEIDLSSPLARRMIPFAKKRVAERSRQLVEWEKSRPRRSFTRIDYRVKPVVTSEGRVAIRSADIEPTETLKQEWEKRRQTGLADWKNVVKEGSITERNVQVLLKGWFLRQITAYDATPDEKKGAFLDSVTEQLQKIQKFYNAYLEKIGLPQPSELEVLRDFEFTSNSWFYDTSPEELARLLWFKDLVVTIVVEKRMGTAVDIDPLIFRPEPDFHPDLADRIGGLFKRRKASSRNADSTVREALPKADASNSEEVDFF